MTDIILDTAGIHDIGEREVFTRAHEAWFGNDNKRCVEDAYCAYLLRGNPEKMPWWVRHYCRKEIALFLEKEWEGDGFMLFIRGCIAKARRL